MSGAANEQKHALIREMQKVSALLGCIQYAAEYGKEADLDFADAIASVRGMVTAITARLDAVVTGKEGCCD